MDSRDRLRPVILSEHAIRVIIIYCRSRKVPERNVLLPQVQRTSRKAVLKGDQGLFTGDRYTPKVLKKMSPP